MGTLDEMRELLASGQWLPAKPVQVRAQVPVKIPGGPVIKRVKSVYRGRVLRRNLETGKPEQESCDHNHLKYRAAEACAKRAAARFNHEDTRTVPACELIGHNGQYRLPGGHTVYEGVMFNEASARGDRVRLARLDTSGGGIRQVNRWIDWDQPVEVISDDNAGHED